MYEIKDEEMFVSIGGGINPTFLVYTDGGSGGSFSSPGNIPHDNYSYTGNSDYSAANCRGAVTSYAASGTFFGSTIGTAAGTIAGFLVGGPPGASQGAKAGATFGAPLGGTFGARLAAKSKYCSFYY
ncbi:MULTISPECIES: hypothetical protein [unclassified Janthinobacterium]|uniref:hypothetical protein n=1 Tax=unclassified Janthinobacterium TaxID=2610881 RepID=UPI0012F94580|nr:MULTISPECIES: hypothetical protein [unclassified Janthinobacterium]MEC5162481.1 hypothetical protein [Janthinobacterium sp. CG_S6]